MTEIAVPESDPLIVLFDGSCGMCNAAVYFILNHDRRKRFRFAPRETPLGRNLMAQHQLDPDQTQSMVLIDGARAYIRSTAVLRIAGELAAPWSLARLFLIVPTVLRDLLYRVVARYRKRWFKNRICRVPTTEERERFLA